MGRKKAGTAGSIAVIVIFALLLVLPGFGLKALSSITGKSYDIPLKGFTNKAGQTQFSKDSWLSGDFQKDWSARLEESLKPRGVMVTTYNTINFQLFNKSGRIIGKEKDIFEPEYINAELTINPADDFSNPENIQKMTGFVNDLVAVKDKLGQVGKGFLIYIAPSKASQFRDHIPDKYFGISPGHTRAVDVFRAEIEKTDVPYLICADLADETGYPTFYPTGIHWSRTYEQYVSAYLIDMTAKITGKNCGRLQLGNVASSKTPYYRDNDVLDLANVFYQPEITYYQYETSWEQDGDTEELRMLIQGDSFSEGLRKDILDNNESAEIYHITNDSSVMNPNGEVIPLHYDWANLDWQYYLDHADMIVVEIAEPFVKHCTYGFIQELSNRLDSYTPAE